MPPSSIPLLPSAAAGRHLSGKDDKLIKKLQHRPTTRISVPLLLSVVLSLVAAVLSVSALLRPPKTLTVYRCGRDIDTFQTFLSRSSPEGELTARAKLLGVVGVFTGLESTERREALRATWFPSDPDSLANLEHDTRLSFRFVIGRTRDDTKMAELRNEEEKHHDFLFIDLNEENAKPPYKMLAFLKAAFSLFEADFYVKADDSIYLRPDRLATLFATERTHRLTYIGCMKKGPVVTDTSSKWYEGQSGLIGNEYFTHAHGAIYALSAEVVSTIVTAKNDSLRMFSNEDVTIGSWMLSMNVHHEDNRAICESQCSPTSIAVWDMSWCSGLCDPVNKLKQLHNNTMCSKSPTVPEDGER